MPCYHTEHHYILWNAGVRTNALVHPISSPLIASHILKPIPLQNILILYFFHSILPAKVHTHLTCWTLRQDGGVIVRSGSVFHSVFSEQVAGSLINLDELTRGIYVWYMCVNVLRLCRNLGNCLRACTAHGYTAIQHSYEVYNVTNRTDGPLCQRAI